MKPIRLSILLLFATACGVAPLEEDELEQATTCAVKLAAYPVRAKHNNGYDSTAGNSSMWTCDDAHSNSDYNSTHLGNDIWAAEGAPVAATVDGKLTLVGFSSYSGNKVTIIDKCGWYHFFCHLQKIAPGIANGQQVKAGTIIGYVGKTGTASNGVVHLHYSIYPDGNYDAGINPWPALHAVEQAVCGPYPPPPPPNKPPTGTLDKVKCAAQGLTGTASDPDVPATALRVVLWLDDTKPANTFLDIKANQPNHGFVASLPAKFYDGQDHKVLGYTYDTTDTKGDHPVQLAGSPATFRCDAPPVGDADGGAGEDMTPPAGQSPDLAEDPGPSGGEDVPAGCSLAGHAGGTNFGALGLALALAVIALVRRRTRAR